MAAVGAGSARPDASAASDAAFSAAELGAICERYDRFGVKASGGPGDNACGAWLEGSLSTAGFVVERQEYDVPYFEPAIAQLRVGERSAPLTPVAIVKSTGAEGVTGRLVLRGAWSEEARCDGAIAIVLLPHRRWSAASSRDVCRPVQAAIADGAAAVVIITSGPTGKGLALNVPVAEALFDCPTAVLAPEQADSFLRAAQRGEAGRLTLHGRGGRRPAFNLIGRTPERRGGGRRRPLLVLSTPRSGWFTCHRRARTRVGCMAGPRPLGGVPAGGRRDRAEHEWPRI